MTAAAVHPAPKKRSWIKWVALGCAAIFLLGILAAATILFVVFGAVKRSDVYTGALARATAHPGVIEAIGEPIEPGFFVVGSVSVSGASGEASMGIPIAGPKGKGKLYVEATKSAGEWQYQTLQFALDDGARIDLLAESAADALPGAAAPAAANDPAAAAGVPALDSIIFALDDAAEVRERRERFPAGVTAVLAGVHFTSVGRDDEIVHRWYRDGEKVDEQLLTAGDLWDEGPLPAQGWFTLRLGAEEGLASGTYTLDVWLNGTRAQSGTFTIE